MISTRYGRSVSFLLAFALFPILVHTYLGLQESDGLVTNTISHSLAGLRSEQTQESSQPLNKGFDSVDWIDRRYSQNSEGNIRLLVARSYDHKRLYHHPEIGLTRGIGLDDLGTKRVPDKAEIPIHLLKASNASSRDLVAYSLLYDKQFVDDPFQFLIQTAWSSLFQVRKPMTLFFVHDPSALPDVPLSESRAVRLLLEAVDDFLSQKTSPPA